jgi:Tfp pilus assembly protein PilO
MSKEQTPTNRLTRQIQIFAKVQIALGVAMVVAGLAFYFGVYRPQDQAIAELNQQISGKRAELMADQSQTGRLPRVELQLRELNASLAGFKKLPPDPQLGIFIHDINQASQEAALNHLTIEPGSPVRDALYSEEPIALNFKGSFPAVASFIRQVEDMDRLTRVQDVTIKNANSADDSVDVSLTVDIYFAEAQ